jgi:hypothetical protein
VQEASFACGTVQETLLSTYLLMESRSERLSTASNVESLRSLNSLVTANACANVDSAS